MERPDHVLAIVHQVALSVLPILAAVIFHEVAHGVVALRLGDDTALRLGRLTLNPLPHIDPIGTVLMPLLLLLSGLPVFGYARPVPVDYSRLHRPRRDMVLVAAAGPGTNLVLAVASAIVFQALKAHLMTVTDETATSLTLGLWLPLAQMAQASVIVNVSLAIFNMLPLPPLDGGRVATGLLPAAQARLFAAIEPFGFLILAVLIMTGSLRFLIRTPIELVTRALL